MYNKEEAQAEFGERFKHHPPANDSVANKHQIVRRIAQDTAERIMELVPPGREQALSITKIEEAMMWANAGIARHSN